MIDVELVKKMVRTALHNSFDLAELYLEKRQQVRHDLRRQRQELR